MDSAAGGGLGAAQGEITLSADGALRALNQVSSGLKNLDSQSRTQGGGLLSWASTNEQALNTVGKGLLGVGATFLGAFGLATNTAADFEQQMSAVGSVTGATGDTLAAMRDEALRLGASTSFSASESAIAMEILAKAGATTEQILEGATEDVMNLSAATGVDVPLAAETAATAMNIFGTSSENAADTIAQSANASALDVNDWALALKAAGPVAASLGLDMEDLAQAMVILGDAGIKGETGGTALRNILMGLADPAGEASVGLRELGVETHNADGSFRGLEEVTHDLAAGWGEMDAAQKLQIATMVAGEQGAASFIALMDAQTAAVENGSDAFQDASTRMDETGTASTQAQARMDNFRGSWEELTGAIETVAIEVGSKFLPIMRSAVDALTGFVRRILDLPSGVQTAIGAFVGLTGVLAAGAGSFLLMLPRIAETRAALQSLGGVSGILGKLSMALRGLVFSPVFLVALAGFAAYKTNFLGFGDAVRRVAKGVKEFFDGFSDGWKTIKGNPLEKFLRSVQRGLASIGGENTPEWIAKVARGFGDAANIVRDLSYNFQKFRNAGVGPLTAALFSLGAVFPGLRSVLEPMVGIVASVREAFSHLGDALSAFLDGDWKEGFTQLGEAAQDAWDAITEAFELGLDLLMAAWDAIDWAALWDGLTDAGSAIVDRLGDVGSALWDWFTGVVSGIDWGGALSAAWDVLASAGSWLAGKLGDAATALWNWIVGQVQGVDWQGAFTSAWSVLTSIGSWLVGAFGDAIASIGTWLVQQVQGVDWQGAFTTGMAALSQIGTWIADTLGSIIETFQTWISDQISGVNWESVASTFGSKIRSAITTGVQGMVNIFAILLSWVSDQIRGVDWASVGSTFAELLVTGIKGIVGLIGLAGWLLAQVAAALLEVDWGGLATAFGNLLLSALKGLVGFLYGFATTIYDELTTELGNVDWEGLGSKVTEWASAIWNGITDALDPIIDAAVESLNWLIDQLNRIPGVDIPKIGGIESIGTDADVAAQKVVSLQDSLRSLATGGIFGMDDRSRSAASQVGYTPYANPYNPTEGGNGSMGGVEYTPLSDLFSGAIQGATDYAAALETANERQGAVSDSAVPMSTNLTAAGTGFTTLNTEVGTTSNTLLTFVGGAAALLAGFANAVTANVTTATTSFATVPPAILAAQTSFTTLVGAVAGLMAGFSNAITANTNTAMDTLKSRVSGATSSAKSSVIELVTATASLMAGFSSTVVNNTNTAMDTLKSRASGATASAKSSFIELSGSIRGSMAEATAAIGASANGWAGIIRNAGGAMNAAGLYAGSMAGAGVAQGLLNMLASVQAAAAAIINVVTTTMAKVGEMRSPSRKTTHLGEMLGIGPAIGIENMIPKAIRAATHYTGAVLDAMQMGGGSSMGGALSAVAYGATAPAGNVTYVHYDVYALKSDEWLHMVQQAETGARFAHARTQPTAITQYLGGRR